MSPFIIKRAQEPTLTTDLTLFNAQQARRLKKIRGEIRQLERRVWWHRIKQLVRPR
jgi:hypothetical protein